MPFSRVFSQSLASWQQLWVWLKCKNSQTKQNKTKEHKETNNQNFWPFKPSSYSSSSCGIIILASIKSIHAHIKALSKSLAHIALNNCQYHQC